MDTNRVIVDPFGRQFRGDSMERFGDDMTELLLSYLSFEDKLRLKCVSKQWNRTILNKQRVLQIWFDSQSKDELKQLVTKTNGIPNVVINRLVDVLKSCPTIQTIRIGRYIRIYDQVLDTITQCCPSLESIAFNMRYLSREGITRFGRRFGQSLSSVYSTEIDAIKVRKTRLLLDLCPNVKSLQFDNSLRLKTQHLRPLNRLKTLIVRGPLIQDIFARVSQMAPRLESIIISHFDYSITGFLMPANVPAMPSLKSLTIYHYTVFGPFLASLPRLAPNLRVLRLFGSFFCDPNYLYTGPVSCYTDEVVTYYESDATDEDVCHLIDGCTQLKTIVLHFRADITSKTIDILIETAKKRPKQSISFTTSAINSEFVKHLKSIANKPNNLSFCLTSY